jgi:hypothetical protein
VTSHNHAIAFQIAEYLDKCLEVCGEPGSNYTNQYHETQRPTKVDLGGWESDRLAFTRGSPAE